MVVASSLSNWLSERSGIFSSYVATCSHDCSLMRQSFCVRSEAKDAHSSSSWASSIVDFPAILPYANPPEESCGGPQILLQCWRAGPREYQCDAGELRAPVLFRPF